MAGDFEAVYTGAVYLEYSAGWWLAGYLVVLFYVGWGYDAKMIPGAYIYMRSKMIGCKYASYGVQDDKS